MSELHSILYASCFDRAPTTSDPVKNLTTGALFTAEIEGNVDPCTVPTDIGEDPREMVKLNVLNNVQAAAIAMGNLVQFFLYGETATCEILKRVNDPAGAMTTFWAQKRLPKDQ